MIRSAIALLAALTVGIPALADDGFIIVQSTTSTQNSGLYDWLLPHFTAETGIEVRVVAVGTGQALRNATNCDGDVVVVHARSAEDRFVAGGYGVARHDLMANDFVLVGPATDPAGIADAPDAAGALAQIAAAGAPFISRGDDSGTHTRERGLWQAAGINPIGASGSWYREAGAGMGATLNIAVGMNAYTLTDRGTWIAFGNRGNLRILSEGGAALLNPYGVILVSPDHCPTVRADAGQAFIDWLLSPVGQDAIAAFRIDGQQLFFPAAE